MPADVKSEARAPAEGGSLQGLIATREDERALVDALEKAFDYRGDVTLTVRGETVEGFIFDRRRGEGLADSRVRLLTPGGEKRAVGFDEIERVEFTGRDAAHGKSFETWVKKFTEKRLKGESANIHSESLD